MGRVRVRMSVPLAVSVASRIIIAALLSAAIPVGCFLATPSPAEAQSPPLDLPRIADSDNLEAAGTLRDGVLILQLEARDGIWHPRGEAGRGLPVAAFAEAGKPPQNPGPLIRVPAGTEVRTTVRNRLAVPLAVYGLGDQRGMEADSFVVAPGADHEARFTPDEPGIYYYLGRTAPVPHLLLRDGHDSQLNGVLVVDPPGEPMDLRQRYFMISWWGGLDTTAVSGLEDDAVLVINGRSWPHTELFDVVQGDSLHWAWVNATIAHHPMHLHGFYFRMDGRGDGAGYRAYAPGEQHLAVTETLGPGGTMALAWSPDRPGNWIFHCHFAGHITTMEDLNKDRRMPEAALPALLGHGGHGGHAAEDAHDMEGLVLGIRVAPRGPRVQAASGEPRPIRLLILSKPAVYGEYVGYGYVLGGSPEERDPAVLSVPGPTLVLEKDQPVAINIVNQTHEAAAVHWHGIELESYPDGVPGWSGHGETILPAIPPGDSLTVEFTPPRAGTFKYHSHFNEFQQIASGLYGAIVVLEPGQRYDPDSDRILLFSDDGPTVDVFRGPFPMALLNGQVQPEPMEFEAGRTYRMRLINIRTDYLVSVSLLDGEEPVEWRLVAKDGADLPEARATARPARLTFAPGEIYDFEFTPAAPAELTLRFGAPEGLLADLPPPSVTVPVRVR